jgi:hypothetical protein
VVAPADAANEELELIFGGDGRHLEGSFDFQKRRMCCVVLCCVVLCCVVLCWSEMKSGKAVGVDRLGKICQVEVVR